MVTGRLGASWTVWTGGESVHSSPFSILVRVSKQQQQQRQQQQQLQQLQQPKEEEEEHPLVFIPSSSSSAVMCHRHPSSDSIASIQRSFRLPATAVGTTTTTSYIPTIDTTTSTTSSTLTTTKTTSTAALPSGALIFLPPSQQLPSPALLSSQPSISSSKSLYSSSFISGIALAPPFITSVTLPCNPSTLSLCRRRPSVLASSAAH